MAVEVRKDGLYEMTTHETFFRDGKITKGGSLNRGDWVTVNKIKKQFKVVNLYMRGESLRVILSVQQEADFYAEYQGQRCAGFAMSDKDLLIAIDGNTKWVPRGDAHVLSF